MLQMADASGRESLEIISQNSSLHKHVYSKLVSLNMCLIQQDRTLHRLTAA